ncbi:MAG: insulinase family protein [Bacteroidetes bacterium]|nr:insulinase family protein [Bacteroidota bacterium]
MSPITKKMTGRFIAGLLVLAAANTCSYAQDLQARLPVDPHVITGKFANGLTYYIRPNAKPENKVELRLVVNAGSILENDNQQGLAHFMEHMNFNGTKNFQKNDLVSYLQSIGVQFGADLNAYTSFDETVFILPIPTDKPENLEKGFQIIEDWAHNALLTDSDIDGERGVVLEESRLGKGAGMRMRDKYFPRLASGTKYAERLPIGKDDILKNFKYGTIRSFYHDWYRPDLQAVMVVGNIDSATAMKMLQKHFGSLQNPKNEHERTYVTVKPRTAPDAMVVTDKEATNAFLQIMYPFTKKHDDITLGDYKEALKRYLVISMLNTRLSDLAQGANPPFVFGAANFQGLIHGYESFSCFAMFGNGGAETAVNAVTAEIVRAQKYGFTETELELAKKDMMSNIEKQYNEREKTESKTYVSEYIRNFLDKEDMPGIENEYSYYKELLPTIGLTDVSGLVKEWTANSNTFTLITAPDKPEEKLPNDADLLAMTKKGLSQDVKPMEEKKVASSLMDSKPTPGKVTATQKDEQLGTTTYTLSNGIKVTIKPTDFKSDEILMRGLKQGGTGSYGVADKYNASFCTNAIQAMGVAAFTPADLDKVTAGKDIRANTFMTDVSDGVQASSTVKDFESMLQLVNLNLTQPRKDGQLFNAYRKKMETQFQNMRANPQMAFSDTLYKVLYNNNPLAIMVPKAEDFEKMNLDRVADIYHNEFGSADGYQFFIVGNVDEKTAIPLIETYLGSIPATNKQVSFKDNGVRPINGVHKLDVKKGSEKQSMIAANFYGDIKYTEDMQLKAQAVAEVLNIKVIEELREKMGGIYTGGFRASVVKEPYEHYNMSLRLPCGPENVDKLLAAANEEIKNLKEKGPDAKDVEKIKSQWLEKYHTSVKENKYWTEKLENVMFWGRDKNNVLDYEAVVNKLSASDIQNAAKQLFNGKNEFISVLYPEPSGPSSSRNSN